MRGTLRSRLLVNATVDPDEAAARLLPGLRPHITPLGTVVGCCLLDIVDLRPYRIPARLGVSQRAAAHRISVEWDHDEGETIVGVWVPGLRTDARLAVALGGRWFPGVHRPVDLELATTRDRVAWSVNDGAEFQIEVEATIVDGEACDIVAGTCLSAAVGVSADHRGRLEAARWSPTTTTLSQRASSVSRGGSSTASRPPSRRRAM